MRHTAVLLLLVALSTPAFAEPLRVSGSVGLGPLVGPMRWEGPGLQRPGQPMGDVDLDGTLVAASIGLGVLFAKPVSSTVALGLGLDASIVFGGGSDAELGYTSYDAGYQLGALARATVRPGGGGGGVVLRFGAGGALASFATSGVDIGAFENVARAEMLYGPAADVSVGWVSGNFRPALALSGAFLFGEHMRYIPITLTARMHFGQH